MLRRHIALAGSLVLLGQGCVLVPRAALEREHARLAEAAEVYATADPPTLPEHPGWQHLLAHAFHHNGELRARYFAWKAAVERVRIAAGYPNTNVSVGFSYLFSDEKMNAWDRTTLNIGFDPMQNLSFPTKVTAAGRVALDEARAAAERFRAAKFALQSSVLSRFYDYGLLAERQRYQNETDALLRLAEETAAAGARAGQLQEPLLRAQLSRQQLVDATDRLEAEEAQQRAALNALVGRAPNAPLPLPSPFPHARPLRHSDAELLAIGVERNPELAALSAEVAGREDALELARLQYLPDVNPFAGFTGSAEQMVGAAVSLSTQIPQIRAGIRAARAELESSEAMLAQTELDRAGRFVATLSALRDSQRQHDWIATALLPTARLTATSLRQRYVSGGAALSEWIEAERLLLDLELARSEARTQREQQLAELEELAGVDLGTVPERAIAARSDGGQL